MASLATYIQENFPSPIEGDAFIWGGVRYTYDSTPGIWVGALPQPEAIQDTATGAEPASPEEGELWYDGATLRVRYGDVWEEASPQPTAEDLMIVSTIVVQKDGSVVLQEGSGLNFTSSVGAEGEAGAVEVTTGTSGIPQVNVKFPFVPDRPAPAVPMGTGTDNATYVTQVAPDGTTTWVSVEDAVNTAISNIASSDNPIEFPISSIEGVDLSTTAPVSGSFLGYNPDSMQWVPMELPSGADPVSISDDGTMITIGGVTTDIPIPTGIKIENGNIVFDDSGANLGQNALSNFVDSAPNSFKNTLQEMLTNGDFSVPGSAIDGEIPDPAAPTQEEIEMMQMEKDDLVNPPGTEDPNDPDNLNPRFGYQDKGPLSGQVLGGQYWFRPDAFLDDDGNPSFTLFQEFANAIVGGTVEVVPSAGQNEDITWNNGSKTVNITQISGTSDLGQTYSATFIYDQQTRIDQNKRVQRAGSPYEPATASLEFGPYKFTAGQGTSASDAAPLANSAINGIPGVNSLEFGDGFDVAGGNGSASISTPGLTVKSDGTTRTNRATSLNFTGDAVTVTSQPDGSVTVNVDQPEATGGTGGGTTTNTEVTSVIVTPIDAQLPPSSSFDVTDRKSFTLSGGDNGARWRVIVKNLGTGGHISTTFETSTDDPTDTISNWDFTLASAFGMWNSDEGFMRVLWNGTTSSVNWQEKSNPLNRFFTWRQYVAGNMEIDLKAGTTLTFEFDSANVEWWYSQIVPNADSANSMNVETPVEPDPIPSAPMTTSGTLGNNWQGPFAMQNPPSGNMPLLWGTAAPSTSLQGNVNYFNYSLITGGDGVSKGSSLNGNQYWGTSSIRPASGAWISATTSTSNTALSIILPKNNDIFIDDLMNSAGSNTAWNGQTFALYNTGQVASANTNPLGLGPDAMQIGSTGSILTSSDPGANNEIYGIRPDLQFDFGPNRGPFSDQFKFNLTGGIGKNLEIIGMLLFKIPNTNYVMAIRRRDLTSQVLDSGDGLYKASIWELDYKIIYDPGNLAGSPWVRGEAIRDH